MSGPPNGLTDEERFVTLMALWNAFHETLDHLSEHPDLDPEQAEVMLVHGEHIRTAAAKLGGDPNAQLFGAPSIRV